MSQQHIPHEDTPMMETEALNQVPWEQHTLTTTDLDLVWYEAGNGPPVVILHGGPGHDHRLMRTLAAPLTHQFRCILPDQ